MSLWLIGSGSMALEYAKILKALAVPFEVIGRGEDSAREFNKKTAVNVQIGGVEKALAQIPAPQNAIIAVGVEQLAYAAKLLIEAGTKRILIEKPAGLDLSEIKGLDEIAKKNKAKLLLAYNRRFYGSIQQARNFIEQDGGVKSARFEFTEWGHVIAPLVKAPGVKERWLVGNSSHVIDLAFHIIGSPVDWKSWHAGSLDWHPNSARFAGAGVTDQAVLFSYIADWQAPGRWGLELLTAKHRLVLCPLEKLQVMPLGTIKLEMIDAEDDLDQQFKPGLYLQTQAFIQQDDTLFCSISQQVRNMEIYSQMAGYDV